MKKFSALLLAAMLVVVCFSGCKSLKSEPVYTDGKVSNDYFSVTVPSGFSATGTETALAKSGNKFITLCYSDGLGSDIAVAYHNTGHSRPQVTGSREYFEVMFAQYAGYASAELIEYDPHADESVPYVKFAVRAVKDDGSVAYHYFIYVTCGKEDCSLYFYGPDSAQDTVPEVIKAAYDSFAPVAAK